MRRFAILFVLILVLAVGIQPTLAAPNCGLSFETRLAPDEATSGHIAQAFSTHRSAPAAATGTVVYAPANFDVLDQRCVDGLSWVQLVYTSGTTAGGKQASTLGAGWALESQIYDDYYYGAGYWLAPGDDSGDPEPPPPSTSCEYSLPVQLSPDDATTGKIADAFSTHRSAPGAADGVRVLAPAAFDVLDQRCVNGFSWVQIIYTSGTTAGGKQASSLGAGWALESQRYNDGIYGAGYWLVP